MDKKRILRAIAVLGIAVGAGHLVQTMAAGDTKQQVAAVKATPKATDIVQLAAETDQVSPQAESSVMGSVLGAPADSLVADTQIPASAESQDSAPIEVAAAEPDVAAPAPAPAEPLASDACPITLDLMSEPSAMIGVTLIAPCHANERIVLKHAGLSISALTTATGSLFTSIPAFETAASLEVMFQNQDSTSAQIDIPELAEMSRFGVQWQADDAFQIHAFENDADYGAEGHVSAADTHTPAPGALPEGGFLTLLGDDSVEFPMLAEVYTFPLSAEAKPEIVVEAAVTEQTCGRELLGETLTSTKGEVFVTELTVAMPECAAVGDYLVLKNLVPDLNIASAN